MAGYYPNFVIKTFDGFKTCGILRHGMMRIKCRSWPNEKVVAYSCKKRGFCTSCAHRFMQESTQHMWENILPEGNYRQIVLTLPFDIRYYVATNAELLNYIIMATNRAIYRVLKSKAQHLGMKNPKMGSLTFIQKFGSKLNLNPHLHLIVLERAFSMDSKLSARDLPAINSLDLQEILHEIVIFTSRFFRRKGYIDEAENMIVVPPLDKIFAEHEELALALAESQKSPPTDPYEYDHRPPNDNPSRAKEVCHEQNGFNIHGATTAKCNDRKGLLNLLQYMARPALSQNKVRIEGEVVVYELHKPLYSGQKEVRFSKEKFIRRLAALVPLPRRHLVRHHGVFARDHHLRKLVIRRPGILRTLSGKLPCPTPLP